MAPFMRSFQCPVPGSTRRCRVGRGVGKAKGRGKKIKKEELDIKTLTLAVFVCTPYCIARSDRQEDCQDKSLTISKRADLSAIPLQTLRSRELKGKV
ncbi:hypothetical protein BDV27DRAFT_138674 [Aspergillus caelatus]|uniref:Uncharacterized protein n=2 Tax=Aspergillus subgen. Circumdati TaxID=2720871 RepID=A0A5N6ZJK9_9EURO|nr:uncharacterized protein BDV27DRAFT_138674 [Aspergillus caelatus]KAE8357812.1 hypothetical protein BDV27DRAFT_138674 [Aspergillus caelatus]KAE8417739.1 hypothetical protein BDV36DRAFT_170191 [Aspergillus pseudocaelatus]